jgi:hypothetical protein
MEKFGEWKGIVHAHDFESGGQASWDIDVLQPGDYNVDLTYAGEGRPVWRVAIEGVEQIQNQQNTGEDDYAFGIDVVCGMSRGFRRSVRGRSWSGMDAVPRSGRDGHRKGCGDSRVLYGR